MADPIDFGRLAQALLDRAESFVSSWLSGGKRVGHEWECSSLGGGRGSSCKVNLNTGRWADFASDEKGGDLVSLYAAVQGIDNGAAARRLMQEMGWAQPDRPRGAPAPAKPVRPPAQPTEEPKARTTWTPIVPVPPGVPSTDLKHWQRGLPEMSWRYELDGHLYGFVARYRKSDGDKDIVPWTWCQDKGDDRGLMQWHMKQWQEPRPLYVPLATLPPDLPVLVVEGEKCAQAAQESLAGEWLVVSWPGGGKAWDRAAWDWIAGRSVVLWGDCDAKHIKLTKAERDAGVPADSKPLLPADKQPGVAAMAGIGQHLLGLGCAVSVCPLPEPGAVSDGWDVADAIDQGWAPEQIKAFIAAAKPLGPVKSPAPPDCDYPQGSADAGPGRRVREWQSHLLVTDKGGVKACRENVVSALDGVPGRGVPGVLEVRGVVAFNEFTNNVVKLKPTPWGTPAGPWLEEDELEMGEWLVREHSMPSMPRTALEEAVKMVSGRHRYHPVREYLEGVRGTWDGTKRLAGWLQTACNVVTPVGIDEVDHDQYIKRISCWMLMAMCARVLTPGCKFDYMVIFEGGQGVGKSTLASTLGGDWFADTGLVLGDKDSYQNLQGVWVYEWGELDSLSKAEVTRVKMFASSCSDRFRASFDRRPRDYPRQVVFIGTTNEDYYLTDPTGNRRFWPVRVGGQIDIKWVRENRDQLFAEALVALDRGMRFHPTHDEQRRLFDVQQGARTVELPIESRIVTYLHDEDQRVSHGQVNGSLLGEISTSDLLSAIGIGIEKQVTAPSLIKQANGVLKKLGWMAGKSSAKGGAKRTNVFKRPPSSTAQVQSHQSERPTDDTPL